MANRNKEIEAIEIELELRRRAELEKMPDGEEKEDFKKLWDETESAEFPLRERINLAARYLSEKGAGIFMKNAGEVMKTPTNVAIEAGGPATGQAIGAATGPFAPVMVPVLGATGGMISDAVVQSRGDEPFSTGRMIGAGVTGAVPGASLAKAGARQVAREGGKYALGNIAGKIAETEIDQGELPTAEEGAAAAGLGMVGAGLGKVFSKGKTLTDIESTMAMRNQVFQDLRKEGVVASPSEFSRGAFSSSLAGKEATEHAISRQNQPIWQKLAREEIGLSKAPAPISIDDLKAVRTEAAIPYEEVGRLTGLDVTKLRQARFDASRAHRAARATGNPEAYAEATRLDTLAENLETAIDTAASALGDPKLVNRLRAARVRIAKTYSVERALNVASGLVDPASLGQQLDRGVPLSGNLLKIARFALSFPSNAREAGTLSAPEVGGLGTAVRSGARGNTTGVASGVVGATVGKPARMYLLSDYLQDSTLTVPEKQNFTSALARYISNSHPESRKQMETEEAP